MPIHPAIVAIMLVLGTIMASCFIFTAVCVVLELLG